MSGCPDLAYEVHGTAGPHVLLVHGMLSSRSHWLPNLPGLSAFGRPVVVELYGHSQSPTPEDPDCYHPNRYVEQFERIRRAVGADRWFTVGQSLGAALTLRYSLAHPERVIAQAFTNSASAFAPPGFRERLLALRAEQQRRMESGTLPAPADSPLNPARNRRISAEVRAALEADISRHDRIGLARTQMYTLPDSSLSGRGQEISVPTLLIAGEREERFATARTHIERSVPGIEVAGLPGGHGVNLDVPEQFNEALLAFFRRFVAQPAAAEP